MTHAETPKAYFYVPATMEVTWDASEFITAEQWLEQQRSAKETEEEVERPEKGHATDQLQAKEQQPEKRHAADHREGEGAT